MLQSKRSGKTTVLGIVVAFICILVYLFALVSAIVRINTSMEERRLDADTEFQDLADKASSAGVISFMDEAFIDTVQNALNESRTLEGVIISGPNGEYGFEKESGKALLRVGASPRFRSNFGFSRQPMYSPLRIPNMRNVNIQAVFSILDYNELNSILKQALIFVAIALFVAFFTLLLVSLRRSDSLNAKGLAKSVGKGRAEKYSGGSFSGGKTQPGANADATTVQQTPGYSQRGKVIKEENTAIRLTEELRGCAAENQDLAFVTMELKHPVDDANYARFAADAARFFSSRDFICEKGNQGISVICPGLNLDTGFLNADEFHNRVMGKYPLFIKAKTDLCMGMSARSGRPVNAQRLMFEAEEALERAMMDPVSHIVAFKSDPEKYRAFMESRGN